MLAATAGKHIVFVCGDHEYSGEHTLPVIAAALEKDYGFRCTVVKSMPDQNGEEDIPGLEALSSADLAVFYLRWRRLPAGQVELIDRYVKSGRPVFGYRTSSHSFRYPDGHPLVAWNAWGSEAFGTPPGWGGDGHTHFGHDSTTDVRVAPGAVRFPMTKGITPTFHVRSWLYRVLPKWPPPDAHIILQGTAVNPNKPAEENPVAWTWKNRHGGRAFYTSLGHPEDFRVVSVQRLTVNAIQWCLDPDAPQQWRGPMKIEVPYRGIVQARKPGE